MIHDGLGLKVEVLPFRPLSVATHQPVDGGQYQIRVNGIRVGFIGYHYGASPMLHKRFSPMELVEIEQKVREQLPNQGVRGIVQVGEMPKPKPPPQERKIIVDDFTY